MGVECGEGAEPLPIIMKFKNTCISTERHFILMKNAELLLLHIGLCCKLQRYLTK